MSGNTLPVTRIQRFSTHDGAGVRTVVFLKGCPLRCVWCHNPETQRMGGEVLFDEARCIGCRACAAVCPAGAHRFDAAGAQIFDRLLCRACMACVQACPTTALSTAAQELSIEAILRVVLRDRPFYGESGGLTVSGGEPMAHPEGTLALLQAAKAQGLTTAIETCGQFAEEYLPRLAAVTDEFLWDFKDSDSARLLAHTGTDGRQILRNLRALDEFGVHIVLRCILVRGVNLNREHARAVRALRDSLAHVVRVDLLPYHPYGSAKTVQLGRAADGRPEWVPSAQEVAQFRLWMESGAHDKT